MGNSHSSGRASKKYNATEIKVSNTEHTINMEGFPINNLPDDVLQTILIHVDGKTLVKSCVFACKRWKAIIDLQTLWKTKCDKKYIFKPNINIEVDFKRLFFFNPYSRNLLKNGNASEGFNHWEILERGFILEEDKCAGASPVHSIGDPTLSKCWATSYFWCSKEQLINLEEEGCDFRIIDTLKPTIHVSEWTTARTDCASKYVLSVFLLDENKTELQSCKKVNEVQQWIGGEWTQVSNEFVDYPVGVRYIKFNHSGKDNQFWAGHYGPKCTGASVKFIWNGNNI